MEPIKPVPFDGDFAREQFPTLNCPGNDRIAFFDNAGGSLPCGAVVDRLHYYYTHNRVQPGPIRPLGRDAEAQMNRGRTVMAELLGLPEDTITLGASTTQNLNTLSLACSRFIGKGDEIIVTEQDHEANIGGWQRLAGLTGAVLKFWPVNETSGELDPSELGSLLSARTRLVCVTHSSNIIGSLNPITEIAGEVHHAGAKIVVDGVSFAPHHWPDIPSYGVDAYCFSTYKTFGTHQGVMYVSPEFREELVPQCHFFNEKTGAWKLLDSAGPDHASIAALAGIGDFFRTLHTHHFGSSEISLYEMAGDLAGIMNGHERALGSRILKGIEDLPLRLLGKRTMEGREANFSLLPHRGDPREMVEMAAERQITVSHGHFYAYRLLQKMGIKDREKGILRISLAHYNREEEADRLIQFLQDYCAR